MIRTITLAFLVSLAFLTPARAGVHVTPLCDAPKSDKTAPIRVSRNGRHVAWIESRGDKKIAVIDGKPDPEFDAIDLDSRTFEGDRFLYTAKRNGKAVFVADGNVLTECDQILAAMFSPGGSMAVVIAKSHATGKQCVAVDGKTGSEFDEIFAKTVCFSPDGKRFAYIGKNRERSYSVVVDGKIGQEIGFVYPYSLCFSPDGKRVAYVARNQLRFSVVIDGKAGPEYASIDGEIKFGSDGTRIAYTARKNHTDAMHLAVLDDAGKIKEYEGDLLAFNPFGKQFVYRKNLGGISMLVVDGKTVAEGDNVYLEEAYFNPDGARWAYMLDTKTSDGGLTRVIVDGVPGPASSHFYHDSFTYSPNGKRFAYVMMTNGKFMTVTDHKPGREYPSLVDSIMDQVNGQTKKIRPGTPFFSDDSQHLAYVARKGYRAFTLVLDEKEGETFEEINAFAFSPDSKHLAYAATKDGKTFAVLDSKVIPDLEVVLDPLDRRLARMAFDAQDVLEYLAVSEGKLVRVRVTPDK